MGYIKNCQCLRMTTCGSGLVPTPSVNKISMPYTRTTVSDSPNANTPGKTPSFNLQERSISEKILERLDVCSLFAVGKGVIGDDW